jgi:hypothetical protein
MSSQAPPEVGRYADLKSDTLRGADLVDTAHTPWNRAHFAEFEIHESSHETHPDCPRCQPEATAGLRPGGFVAKDAASL